MKNSKELKPCPFCDGHDTGILTTSYDGFWYAVYCENCMAHTRKCRTGEEAIEAWEMRPESQRAEGQWVGEADGYADGELVYDVWYCSECNHCIDDGTDNPEDLPNYCSNCGAKMEV